MKETDISVLAEKDMSGYTQTQLRMATEKLGSLVFTYSLPTVVGMFVNALYNIVDRFWVGKMEGEGALALTGIGLMMPIMNIIMGFAQLVGIGAAANISIKLGQNNRPAAEKVLNNALILSVIFAAFISTFGLILAPGMLRLIGASDATLPYALDYGLIILGGCVFQLVSFSMNHCIRATGNPKRFASTQLLGACVNMVLDPVFIFVFDMGAAGVAIATVIAQFVSAVWVFSFYFSKNSELRFRFKAMIPDMKVILPTFAIGLSPFLMQISGALVNGLLNNTLYYYGNLEYGSGGGDLAVGAMTLMGSIAMLLFTPVIGINQGSQPIIGFNYGRKDFKRVKETFKWACIYGTLICFTGWLGVMFFAHTLVAAFNTDPLLMTITTEGIRINLFFLPLIAYQAQSSNFFTAIGRAKMAIVLSALRQIIVLIPLFLLLPRFMGLMGIWYAYPIADFLAVVLTAICITREFRIIEKRAADEVDRMYAATGEAVITS